MALQQASPPTHVALETAIREWRSIVGAEHVVTASGELQRAGQATFPVGNSVLAIVRPANREEVQECVRAAARLGVPIYPLSTGKNWGYGSSAPTADACLLELGRLNRILEFNEELAYVIVEPGVTQQQLFDFLQARASRLWIVSMADVSWNRSGSTNGCI